MDPANDPRLGEHQEIVVALEVPAPVAEPFTPVLRFAEAMGLDHGPHRPIEDEEALGKQSLELGSAVWLEHGHLD